MSQLPTPVDGFRGTVRLFPLPNLVLFPHVAQPLHIFEPRYRQMMADALEDDRLLGMALLRPGWEEDYHKKPPIHPMICLGRIVDEVALPDGRYNLMLHGLVRGRIREEMTTDRPYRVARVDLCHDEPIDNPGLEQALRQELGRRVLPFFSGNPQATAQLQRLLQSNLPLGALCDIFSFVLPGEPEVKQLLLEELNVERRVRALLTHAHSEAPVTVSGTEQTQRRRPFPPGFSEN